MKFTTEDDQLLIELKEKKNLTWKQIADFFPGRSSGTLQVRYCTKLKAKTKQWNAEMVSCPEQDIALCARSPLTSMDEFGAAALCECVLMCIG